MSISKSMLQASFNNITISNVVQRGSRSTSLFWMEDGDDGRFNKVTINNFNGNKSGIIYSLNTNIELIASDFYEININTTNAAFSFLYSTVVNLSFNGALFNINETPKNPIVADINSSIDSCLSNRKLYEEYSDSVLLLYNTKNEFDSFMIDFKNCSFKNFYGDTGIKTKNIDKSNDQIEIENLNFNINLSDISLLNSYFENSFIYINNNNLVGLFGKITFNNAMIRNNTSKNSGGIIHIKSENLPNIVFFNSTFENNYTEGIGDIILSENHNPISDRVRFIDCKFNCSNMKLGIISYSHNFSSEAYFSNKKELMKMYGKYAFVTNPSIIRLNNGSDSIQNISVDSGEYLNKKIILINTGSDMKVLDIKNLMFFKLEMNDTYNTEIKGQTEDYCFETKCELPNFKK
ncbi:hypothetical protein PIROE2DRAFT_12273 [Piromyces sp. E2]|nr:hypothetical protein PIROE2DRAFT_12273 [Piromyces sp. E2]|eukprot:OUM61678.1 hypothetical protein PIROE2DRAFT_12273 [Piromyces sp. E2]